MSAKRYNNGPGHRRRSADQRRVNAAVPAVMAFWEDLTDQERLGWDVGGAQRRMSGVNYFKKVNLRRLLRGQEMTRVSLQSKPCDPRRLLKRLDIRNRGGRITLELELWRKPDTPCTVWASLPCNRGLKKPTNCPRLGWLPDSQSRWREITGLYFKKHGEYIRQHGLQLVGKRIFIRLRPETDDGAPLYEEVRAVVPKVEVQIGKKGPVCSKHVRILFEASSKSLRNITRTSRGQQAAGWPRAPGRRRKARV